MVSSSGTLPAGLNLNSASGLLSGTPTATGDFAFKVTATDGARSDTQTYAMSVVQPLKITTTAAPAAEVGRPFDFTLGAEGGKQAYAWSLASGSTLPDGLSLDTAKSAISGTPTAVGTTVVKVTVTDALGLTQTLSLKIAVAQQLTITRRALPTAHVGQAYRARLFAVGGVAPKTWSILRGSLPSGIRLNRATGALTGAATKTGTSHVTIEVTDNLGAISKTTFVLKVK